MEEEIKKIKQSFLNQVKGATALNQLDKIYLAFFGKNGQVTLLSKEFPKLSPEEKRSIGPLFNQVKKDLEVTIEEARQKIREAQYSRLADEELSLKETAVKKRQGYLHPITKFEMEIVELFGKLGFAQFDAPHIDTGYYNFEALNIPEGHPARDLWDTLYIDKSNLKNTLGELLLRTHTSNAQIRAMKKLPLPMRIMIIDRCFRYENLDARHEHTFEQFELVYIDKNVNMANLQYLSEYFLKNMLGEDIQARLRPKYYPFVEPGAGVDALCIFCKGKGCNICSGVGWLEIGGAGMVHPQVLKNAGIDPNIYSGIAWGTAPERMSMLKYGIQDIRLFKSGDLNLLKNIKEDK